MPGYQNTFTLITERVAPVTDEPARPMTSKQVKKAHKAANKAPKLSRAEQRKIELAEQERIRKELERDRQANRARHAREKKKAKEDCEKEERRKKGRPLVDVRPSQDTIARFVRGNGWGRKRDDMGTEVAKMAPVIEEEPEMEDRAEADAKRGESVMPVLAPEADEQPEEEQVNKETTIIESETRSQSPPDNEKESDVDIRVAPGVKVLSQPVDDSDLSGTNVDEEHALETSQAHIPSAREPQKSGQGRDCGVIDAGSQGMLARGRPHPSLPLTSKQEGEHLETEEPGPLAVSTSQFFWDDGLDDDSMQELEAAEEPIAHQERPDHAPEEQDHDTLPPATTLRATQRTLVTQQTNYGDIEDDVLAGIGTQAVGLWEMEDEDSLLAEQPVIGRLSEDIIAEDDAALKMLDAILEGDFSPEPVRQPSTSWKDNEGAAAQSHQLRDGEPPPSAQQPKEFSSFAEDDLDDDLLQQLDIELQLEVNATVRPTGTMKSTPNVEQQAQGVSRHNSSEVDRGYERSMPPPPIPQQPPMSTQAVLFNLDDYFPSPSQQERELDDDLGGFLKTQPTPCPPPKRARPPPPQQKPPLSSPPEQPKSQKRFFSASGSNELLSLAIHRSKRDIAMNDLHRKDQQRFEAGRAQAKQAGQQGRQFMPQRQNALRPISNQSGRQPRPAGKPPAWVTHENIEPPPKRQKISRTKSQVRPPVFKQPAADMPKASPRPPVFKPTTKPPLQISGKENQQEEFVPLASQGSDYGGDWIDEMAMDMASTGRGCLSATQITMDRGNGRWIR